MKSLVLCFCLVALAGAYPQRPSEEDDQYLRGDQNDGFPDHFSQGLPTNEFRSNFDAFPVGILRPAKSESRMDLVRTIDNILRSPYEGPMPSSIEPLFRRSVFSRPERQSNVQHQLRPSNNHQPSPASHFQFNSFPSFSEERPTSVRRPPILNFPESQNRNRRPALPIFQFPDVSSFFERQRFRRDTGTNVNAVINSANIINQEAQLKPSAVVYKEQFEGQHPFEIPFRIPNFFHFVGLRRSYSPHQKRRKRGILGPRQFAFTGSRIHNRFKGPFRERHQQYRRDLPFRFPMSPTEQNEFSVAFIPGPSPPVHILPISSAVRAPRHVYLQNRLAPKRNRQQEIRRSLEIESPAANEKSQGFMDSGFQGFPNFASLGGFGPMPEHSRDEVTNFVPQFDMPSVEIPGHEGKQPEFGPHSFPVKQVSFQRPGPSHHIRNSHQSPLPPQNSVYRPLPVLEDELHQHLSSHKTVPYQPSFNHIEAEPHYPSPVHPINPNIYTPSNSYSHRFQTVKVPIKTSYSENSGGPLSLILDPIRNLFRSKRHVTSKESTQFHPLFRGDTITKREGKLQPEHRQHIRLKREAQSGSFYEGFDSGSFIPEDFTRNFGIGFRHPDEDFIITQGQRVYPRFDSRRPPSRSRNGQGQFFPSAPLPDPRRPAYSHGFRDFHESFYGPSRNKRPHYSSSSFEEEPLDNSLLGSGNFEVIRGGIYYDDDSPHSHDHFLDDYDPPPKRKPPQNHNYVDDFFSNFRDFSEFAVRRMDHMNEPDYYDSHPYSTNPHYLVVPKDSKSLETIPKESHQTVKSNEDSSTQHTNTKNPKNIQDVINSIDASNVPVKESDKDDPLIAMF